MGYEYVFLHTPFRLVSCLCFFFVFEMKGTVGVLSHPMSCGEEIKKQKWGGVIVHALMLKLQKKKTPTRMH